MEEEEERPAVTACGEGISSTTSGWSSFQETLGRMEREARACPAYTLALRIFAQHRMLESENDFLVGLEGLHLGASQGDADAAVVLGTLYREGIVVDEDVRRALACYRKGADLGHPMAMNDLALLYENGIEGVLQQDVAEAIRLYRLAAENGLHLALANLAGLYLDGAPGLSPDPEEALALFARAAARGCVSAMLSLADIYEEGDVVAQDLQKAATCLECAVALGDAEAMGRLGRMYLEGVGRPADQEKALSLMMPAAEMGDGPSLFAVGEMYRDGLPGTIPQDVEKAVACFKKGADAGNGPCQLALGRMHLDGIGVVRDEVAAMELMGLAADGGYINAMETLAGIYLAGYGNIERDVALAAGLLRRAADAGSGLAAMHLALLHTDGVLPDPDGREAAALYRVAADAGITEAKMMLASLHGGPGTAAESRRLFEEAAGEGHALGAIGAALMKCLEEEEDAARLGWAPPADIEGGSGQMLSAALAKCDDAGGILLLGTVLELGVGMAEDLAGAASLYHRAAAMGNETAMLQLGRLYERGAGVPQDDAMAAGLFGRAAALGERSAEEALERLRAGR